jgi:hypothetical protein
MRCMWTSHWARWRVGEFEKGKGVAPNNYKMGRSYGLTINIGLGFCVGGVETRCR